MAKSKNKVYDDSFGSKSCRKYTENLNTKIGKFNEELSDSENTLPTPSIESNTSDLQNSNSPVSEHGESSSSIMSKHMIKFVKAADSPIVIKTNKVETARKSSVKYAEMYRNTSKSPKVRGKTWPKNNFAHKNVTPRAVLLKTGRTSIAVNRPNMNVAQPNMIPFSKIAHSHVRRPFQGKSAVRTQSRVPKGKGLAIPTEPHHTPSPQEQQSPHHDPLLSSHLTATTKPIPTKTPIENPTIRQYSRRATRIAQSKAFSPPADEPASLLRDDSQVEAFPTVSSLDAGQDMETINKTSALPNESTTRVTSLDGLSFLKTRMEEMQIPLKRMLQSKGSMEIREEVGVERSTKLGSNDTKEMCGNTIFKPRGILAKDKEEITRENQRMNKQLTRDAEIARLHAEEELQRMIEGLNRNNEVIAKHLQEYEQVATELTIREKIELINELVKYQDHHVKILKYQAQGMTLEEIKEKSILVWKQIEDFVPMSSSEEAQRVKRKGLKLDQGSSKKMKTSKDISEDLKGIMQLVPVEEREYWKIIILGGHTAVYQFFVDMLKQFDRKDLHQLWTLLKKALSIRQPTKDKEKELCVELKRLFEPDFEDQL
uniref:Uncharacterized protein n=1 Tax=Tanacetum cinerariifolium TaxID=118510 RepID=A0A6L2JT59_TANCI|nr:hypothetical protein [Tanacetum cinerariifolium]